jgi:hypothetical protein
VHSDRAVDVFHGVEFPRSNVPKVGPLTLTLSVPNAIPITNSEVSSPARRILSLARSRRFSNFPSNQPKALLASRRNSCRSWLGPNHIRRAPKLPKPRGPCGVVSDFGWGSRGCLVRTFHFTGFPFLVASLSYPSIVVRTQEMVATSSALEKRNVA